MKILHIETFSTVKAVLGSKFITLKLLIRKRIMADNQ